MYRCWSEEAGTLVLLQTVGLRKHVRRLSIVDIFLAACRPHLFGGMAEIRTAELRHPLGLGH
jgi:hypothetical protein